MASILSRPQWVKYISGLIAYRWVRMEIHCWRVFAFYQKKNVTGYLPVVTSRFASNYLANLSLLTVQHTCVGFISGSLAEHQVYKAWKYTEWVISCTMNLLGSGKAHMLVDWSSFCQVLAWHLFSSKPLLVSGIGCTYWLIIDCARSIFRCYQAEVYTLILLTFSL